MTPILPSRPAAADTPTIIALQLDDAIVATVVGENDATLRQLEDRLDVTIHARGNRLTLEGPDNEIAQAVIDDLSRIAERGSPISADTVRRAIDISVTRPEHTHAQISDQPIVSYRGRDVRPSTPGQRDYVDAIDTNTVIFGVGPAGSGKTYLAVAKAVQALQRREVNRIILTRPAVEAGENLGFLPGTLSEKIDPYLRPLHDAMRDMVDPETIPRLIESGIIEVAPLAYMRGRTLNNAFVILDEAQNTTPAQMKMFLTRLGFGSTMVVTGDLTQVDLPRGQASGLATATTILRDVDGVAVVELEADDVVRHRLVSAMVEAYDRYEHRRDNRDDKNAKTAGNEKPAGGGPYYWNDNNTAATRQSGSRGKKA